MKGSIMALSIMMIAITRITIRIHVFLSGVFLFAIFFHLLMFILGTFPAVRDVIGMYVRLLAVLECRTASVK